MASCRPLQFNGTLGQFNQIPVLLSNANFKVLGTYTGMASMSKAQFSKEKTADLISEAKSNLIDKAKKEGAELKGKRALVNLTADMFQNAKRISLTVSGDIIEITK